MIILSTLILSMFITIALIPPFRRLAIRVHALDIPEPRKVHDHPIPKSGGIAMVLGTLMPPFFWVRGDPFIQSVLAGSAIIVVFGLLDDFKNLNYRYKFAGQALAAMTVIVLGGLKIQSLGMLLPDGVILPDWISVPLTLVFIVGVTNAINLADGLDGLAGGISLLSFICIGYMAFASDQPEITILCMAMAGAILGFLRFNTYPAALFMGDTGSQFLGFLAVSMALRVTQENAPFSPVLPLLVLGLPILDTLAVMIERIREGRSPFSPDKNHIHHKLIRLGFFHTEAVVIIYVLQAALVTSAIVFRYYTEGFLLALYLSFCFLILAAFSVAEYAGWQFKRSGFIDVVVLKGRLRMLKDKNILIHTSSKSLEVMLPFLLIFTCFLSSDGPGYVSIVSAGLIVMLLSVRLFKAEWTTGAIRLCLYLTIPYAIYLSENHMAEWMDETAITIYNLSFGLLVLLVITTLKFTRRRQGFRISTMDFLVLFIALIVPNIPDTWIRSYHMGLLAAKMVAFFFSYEVLIGELRGKFDHLVVSTIAALGILSTKALMS